MAGGWGYGQLYEGRVRRLISCPIGRGAMAAFVGVEGAVDIDSGATGLVARGCPEEGNGMSIKGLIGCLECLVLSVVDRRGSWTDPSRRGDPWHRRQWSRSWLLLLDI